MADLKTTVTELGTALGMFGDGDVAGVLAARPKEMVSVSPERWDELQQAFDAGGLKREFQATFDNGRAFFEASDGLRGRRPLLVEWKGAHANPGDEVLPVDLRVDHVFLISCKYLSKILHNASPRRVFDHSLRQTRSGTSVDWFHEVASNEYQHLFDLVVDVCDVYDLPSRPIEMTNSQRRRLRESFPERWPAEVEEQYAELCDVVAQRSSGRWNDLLRSKSDKEATLWRLLRFGHAPYFVLGSAPSGWLRLRVATPWDWRRRFDLKHFKVEPRAGGQAMVAWSAEITDRHSRRLALVDGHVEIRWSHGRFGGSPEAKVYLDTPHSEVPGYFPL